MNRTVPSLLVAVVVALVAAGCDRPSATAPTPAPSPAPAPQLKPLDYSWSLTDDQSQHTKTPDSYTVTYLSGALILRSSPRVMIGFRVEPAYPDNDSRLLKTNIDTAAQRGWQTTPATVDGGTGISFMAKTAQVTTAKTAVAKGAVSLTVNVDSRGPGDDSAAKSLHDALLAGLRFRSEGLSGPYPGTVATPRLPFDIQVPADLAGPYQSEYVAYAVELSFGKFKTTVSTSWQEPADAAASFTTTREQLRKSGVRHQNDVRALPALKDNLGLIVDEGFSFSLVAPDQVARYVGVVFRRGGITVRVFSNVGDIKLSSFDADTNAALSAPMGVARTWQWSQHRPSTPDGDAPSTAAPSTPSTQGS